MSDFDEIWFAEVKIAVISPKFKTADVCHIESSFAAITEHRINTMTHSITLSTAVLHTKKSCSCSCIHVECCPFKCCWGWERAARHNAHRPLHKFRAPIHSAPPSKKNSGYASEYI